MKITFAKIGCWLLIVPLLLASVAQGIQICHDLYDISHPTPGILICGDSDTLPIFPILNYLSPAAAFGVAGLFILRRRGLVKTRTVAIAAILSLTFATALFLFLARIFHQLNWSVSGDIWWLQPFQILWPTAYGAGIVTFMAVFFRKPRSFSLQVFSVCLLLVFGTILAWTSLSNDFSFNVVNLLAVIPFVAAWAGMIMLIFLWKNRRTA
jgi:hypothetical protein